MLAGGLRWYMTVITEGRDSFTCAASVFISIVSVVPIVAYFVDVNCLVVAPPFHILAVYSQSKRAVDLSPVWTVVGIIAVQFASPAARFSHSPGRLRG